MSKTVEQKRLANNLLYFIKKDKVTYREIERKSGVCGTVVSRWSKGVSDANSRNLLKLCDAMGWRFDYVIGIGEAPNMVCGKDFGGRLANLMIENDETAVSLASKIGVEKSSVTRWIRHGSIPNSTFLVRICALYGVSAEIMIRGHIKTGGRDYRKEYK